jgi:hypothetical protein
MKGWNINIVQWLSVTIDGSWIDDRTSWTLWYRGHYTLQFTITHKRTLMPTVTSSLSLLGSGFHRHTFPFISVPELSLASANSSNSQRLNHSSSKTDCTKSCNIYSEGWEVLNPSKQSDQLSYDCSTFSCVLVRILESKQRCKYVAYTRLAHPSFGLAYLFWSIASIGD